MDEPRPGCVRLVHITTVPQSLLLLRGQVGYMKSLGYDVYAISSPGDELDDFAKIEGITTCETTMTRRISPVRDSIAVFRLSYHLRKIRPHIVHAHTPKGGLLGMLAALLARVPLRIYHIRGLPLATARGPRRRLLRWTERISCAVAHRVLSVSHSMERIASDERICRPGKMKVLDNGSGNGVDAAERFNPSRLRSSTAISARLRFGIPETASVVGFVGRLVRDKGIEELLCAWSAISQQFSEVYLLVAGSFEPHDPVPARWRAAICNHPRIRRVGFTEDTPALYAAMDLLVLPSYREGFPNVVLEAAAMELPVVSTRVPGCCDAVEDGVTGTLVPAQDAASLTEAIAKYLRNPRLRRRHGARGRQRVLRDFQQRAVWRALHTEYSRLLEKRGLPVALPPHHAAASRSAA